jgi:multidrug efflux pump subunit AcrA (membrane-fusion protein)
MSGMTLGQRNDRRHRHAATILFCAGVALAAMLSPSVAQDIRGLEVCTAEKQMERRTGCLQSNIELLQQALLKLGREVQAKVAASERDLAAARAEIGALKATVDRLNSELAQIRAKAESGSKK